MAKITRTFRLDEDLVKRFDEASAIAGVDKTSVVTDAITKFVEKIEMGKFWDTDNLVWLSELYAPFIGKCEVRNNAINLYDDVKVHQTSLKPLKYERKDEEGTRYNIDNVFATIDFENKICKIEYKKFWIGGLVEDEELTFPINWIQEKDRVTEGFNIVVYEDKENVVE